MNTIETKFTDSKEFRHQIVDISAARADVAAGRIYTQEEILTELNVG